MIYSGAMFPSFGSKAGKAIQSVAEISIRPLVRCAFMIRLCFSGGNCSFIGVSPSLVRTRFPPTHPLKKLMASAQLPSNRRNGVQRNIAESPGTEDERSGSCLIIQCAGGGCYCIRREARERNRSGGNPLEEISRIEGLSDLKAGRWPEGA